MALSETALIDAELMAIAEINQTGGILGQAIEPIIEDGASDPAEFIRKAKKLLQQERVTTVFGCWTSATRKAVLPVFEEHNALLWYPVQYEGLESCKNIFYIGSCPNQQVEPAVTWLLQNKRQRFYLLGSDYVFPRTINKLIKAQLKHHGGTVIGKEYVPLGATDFSKTLARIWQARPDVVFSTLNGDSNQAFYRQYKDAGITAEEMPILAVSVAEAELQTIGDAATGHYCSWSYFQSLNTPQNRTFVQNFKVMYGSDRVTSDPIEAAYSQVYLWKQAVESAQSFEVDAVRTAAYDQSFDAPGGLLKIEPNHHVWKHCRIGQILENGQFDIIFSSEDTIKPLPWLGVQDLSFQNAELVIEMLAEVSQGIQQTWLVEQKTRELEATTARLQQEIAERERIETALQESFHTLESTNQQLVNSIDQLQQTQLQLVQSEKMAALGQLVAGIAHEINTPLGAIRSSAGNVTKFLSQTLGELPTLFQSFTLEQSQDFLALLQRALQKTATISAKEERQFKRALIRQLEAEAIENAASLADTLVDMGIYGEIEAILPLLKRPDGPYLLDIAYKLSGLQRGIQTINTATDRASKVVFALKTYARYDPLEAMTRANLIEGIETVLTLYHNQLKKGVELIRTYAELPLILCYPDELNQVWTNLIHNALQAMNNQGTLTIEVAHLDRQVQIKITDSGQGIPEEVKPRIFEPFFTTKPPGEGSGLGLDIVKKIIDKHSGSITVESQPGCTTFSVTLPIQSS
jgi:urea ABC transporter urea binding protein